jgi:hypothetical protein
MEGWFSGAGRSALFDALSEACDRIDANFRRGTTVALYFPSLQLLFYSR